MSRFHEAVSFALAGDPAALAPWLDPDDNGVGAAAFAVYRNTSARARIDALQANYPTVADLVGEDWFRAAGDAFCRQQPGGDPVMAAYGEGFAAWLATFEPARDMPYLAPVARLDRAWTEAHLAADAVPMDRQAVAEAGAGLAGRTLTLIPSARVFWFGWTAPSLWLAHRYPETGSAMDWIPEEEGLLIYRPADAVRALRLDRATRAFVSACQSGRPAGAAALAATMVDRTVDPPTLLARLIEAGVFTASDTRKDPA